MEPHPTIVLPLRDSPAASSSDDVELGRFLRSHLKKDLLKTSDGYLPEGELKGLLQPSRVTRHLRHQFPGDDPQEIERLVEQICGRNGSGASHRRIFAIACMMDELASVKTLLDNHKGICDRDLPLINIGGGEKDLRRRSVQETPLECFQGWSHSRLKLFEQWQWTVSAPVLKGLTGPDCPHFDDRVVLPLTDNRNAATNGGFGRILKVQVHPQHHDFCPDSPDCFFALKILNSTNDRIFRQELEMLRKFDRNNAHPHIVSLLTAWRQGEDSCFLFRWAESDLLKFWETHSPEKTQAFVQWMASQTAGLADGLVRIHEYGRGRLNVPGVNDLIYGRHGDIKPENILWFNSESGNGSLVISDFGLGVFNSRQSRSEIPNADIARTPTYRPPECDISGGKVSRSWDIWTLGCVYAEFVTWLLGGWRLVDDFTDYRMNDSTIWGQRISTDIFFDLVDVLQEPNGQVMGTGAMIKPEVTSWFSGLHNHRDCTQYAHDLLKFVQKRMLIVESATVKRARCDEVARELSRIQARCQQDEAYCLRPAPWRLPDSPEETLPVMVHLSDGARQTARQNRARLRTYRGRTQPPPPPQQ